MKATFKIICTLLIIASSFAAAPECAKGKCKECVLADGKCALCEGGAIGTAGDCTATAPATGAVTDCAAYDASGKCKACASGKTKLVDETTTATLSGNFSSCDKAAITVPAACDVAVEDTQTSAATICLTCTTPADNYWNAAKSGGAGCDALAAGDKVANCSAYDASKKCVACAAGHGLKKAATPSCVAHKDGCILWDGSDQCLMCDTATYDITAFAATGVTCTKKAGGSTTFGSLVSVSSILFFMIAKLN